MNGRLEVSRGSKRSSHSKSSRCCPSEAPWPAALAKRRSHARRLGIGLTRGSYSSAPGGDQPNEPSGNRVRTGGTDTSEGVARVRGGRGACDLAFVSEVHQAERSPPMLASKLRLSFAVIIL